MTFSQTNQPDGCLGKAKLLLKFLVVSFASVLFESLNRGSSTVEVTREGLSGHCNIVPESGIKRRDLAAQLFSCQLTAV